MKIVYAEAHRGHVGRSELRDGVVQRSIEGPSRADVVLAALRATALGPIVAPTVDDEAAILAVHTPGYVDFLKCAWAAWQAVHGDCDALPLAWPVPGLRAPGLGDIEPRDIDGRLGFYAFDAGTPITAGTWTAARAAAMGAATAADLVAGGEAAAFALTRPPGHHAGHALYGGYCYLNNAAIAAERLHAAGAARVAVLDIDYHHGNGTQAIFAERADVLFVSLHADPRDEFPYFAGHADETGTGAGAGYTVNLPLPLGTDGPRYGEALAEATRRIARFGAEALVISLGVDTVAGDPLGTFRLERDDVRAIGAALAALARPTVFVLEGGYAVDRMGGSVAALLTAFADSR